MDPGQAGQALDSAAPGLGLAVPSFERPRGFDIFPAKPWNLAFFPHRRWRTAGRIGLSNREKLCSQRSMSMVRGTECPALRLPAERPCRKPSDLASRPSGPGFLQLDTESLRWSIQSASPRHLQTKRTNDTAREDVTLCDEDVGRSPTRFASCDGSGVVAVVQYPEVRPPSPECIRKPVCPSEPIRLPTALDASCR